MARRMIPSPCLLCFNRCFHVYNSLMDGYLEAFWKSKAHLGGAFDERGVLISLGAGRITCAPILLNRIKKLTAITQT
jgi:hypothetical protein